LSEFAGPDLAVHLANPAGVRQSLTLGELLPHSFRLP
jgi:cytidine deaminase